MNRIALAISAPARQPKLWLGMLLISAILAGLLIRRLRMDVSLQGMTSSSDSASVALDHIFSHYSAAEELLILVSLPDLSARDSESLFRFASRLQQAIADDPVASKQVASFSYRADPQTRQFVEKVIGPSAMFYLTDEQFAQARQRLTRQGMAEQFRKNEQLIAAPGPAAGALSKALMLDPLGLHEFLLDRLASMRPIQPAAGADSDAFLSPDGCSLLIRIAGVLPPSQIEFSKELTASITRLTAQANEDKLAVNLAGAYPIAAHSATAIRSDSIVSVITSITSLGFLFVLVYRRPLLLFLLAIVPVLVGILLGFGVYSLFQQTITPLTAVIGGILAGIGIDYSIQYLAYYHRCRFAGQGAFESATSTAARVGTTAIAAWATSIVGFLAIGFSSVRMLRDFALAGTACLTGAFICTMIVVPAALVLWDRHTDLTSPIPKREAARISLVGLIGWVASHRMVLIFSCLVFMSIPLIGLGFNRSALDLESDMTVLHPRPNPPMDAQDLISQRMGISPGSLLIHLSAETDEQLVILAHEIQARLATPPSRDAGITTVLGLSTFLPDPRLAPKRIAETGLAFADQVVADFDATVADSVFSPEAFAPYRSFLHILLTQTAVPGVESLPPYKELANNFLPKTSPSSARKPETIVLVFTRDSLDRRVDRERILTVIRSQLSGLPGAVVTGMAVLSSDVESSIRHDLPRLIIAAVVVTAGYLLIHFRSIPFAILAMLPTLFSFACVLGTMQITRQHLNLVNIASVPLLIGIDVDYGIFLVGIMRSNKNAVDTRPLLGTSCQGVVVCAAATLLGFGSICFTSIPAVQSLGLAVAAGVTGCAIASLFLLAPILLWKTEGDLL